MGNDVHADVHEIYGRPLAERTRVLLEINNAIVSHLDLAQVLNAVSACLHREINHDLAGLAPYDADRRELRLHALDFPKDQAFLEKGQLIPLVGTPASLAFATRKAVLRHRPDPEEFPAELDHRDRCVMIAGFVDHRCGGDNGTSCSHARLEAVFAGCMQVLAGRRWLELHKRTTRHCCSSGHF